MTRTGIWCGITGALVLLLGVAASILVARVTEIDTAARAKGSSCLRTGRTYNTQGDLVKSGLWWGADGKRHGVKT